MMNRPSELFVISAIILLGFALFARLIGSPGSGISIHWRGSGYDLPPRLLLIALATALCFFAAVYSLWMLPFNRIATLWHFWLTSIGIVVFWISFYRATSTLPDSRTALIWTVFLAPAVVLLAQAIFVWNFIQAISKLPRLHG